jgi:DNA-directed RNA polymerase beta' subunit
MGHIDLPVAVVHPWFLHGAPHKRLASLLQISTAELTQITECLRYVVADPGATCLHRGQILPARDERTSAYQQTEGVRLAVSGEAIEVLLGQAFGAREPDLTMPHVVIRRIPVLPPGLRTDIYPSLPYRYSNLNRHYWTTLRWLTDERLRGAKLGAPVPEGFYLGWRAGLQRSVDALFGRALWLPDNQPPDGSSSSRTSGSVADYLCPPEEGNVRDGFLTRSADFSASAKLVTSDTGDTGTALLPAKMIQTLLQPIISKALAKTGIEGNPFSTGAPDGKQPPQAKTAIDDATAQALVLVSFPAGPWPLVAMRIQPAADHAFHLDPRLFDQVGWENLGQTAKIFSILTDSATQEAERLLTPARLQDAGRPGTQCRPAGNSIFDLTRENLIDTLAQAAWTGTPFPLLPEDSLLLCAADWATG